jgi:hypothetical protein
MDRRMSVKSIDAALDGVFDGAGSVTAVVMSAVGHVRDCGRLRRGALVS